jgi:hypothetical protein
MDDNDFLSNYSFGLANKPKEPQEPVYQDLIKALAEETYANIVNASPERIRTWAGITKQPEQTYADFIRQHYPMSVEDMIARINFGPGYNNNYQETANAGTQDLGFYGSYNVRADPTIDLDTHAFERAGKINVHPPVAGRVPELSQQYLDHEHQHVNTRQGFGQYSEFTRGSEAYSELVRTRNDHDFNATKLKNAFLVTEQGAELARKRSQLLEESQKAMLQQAKDTGFYDVKKAGEIAKKIGDDFEAALRLLVPEYKAEKELVEAADAAYAISLDEQLAKAVAGQTGMAIKPSVVFNENSVPKSRTPEEEAFIESIIAKSGVRK